jgi:hypothetical protein
VNVAKELLAQQERVNERVKEAISAHVYDIAVAHALLGIYNSITTLAHIVAVSLEEFDEPFNGL